MTDVNVNELWEAVWSSDGMGLDYWIGEVRKPDGSNIDLWVKPDYEPNPQDFKVYDLEEDVWILVTLDDLTNAYNTALENDESHCGGMSLDIEDPDACFADIVLQYACWGEVVYG